MGLSEQSETDTETLTQRTATRSEHSLAPLELSQKFQAAEARIAQLERANATLRRGTQRIISADRVEAILDALLLEAVSLTGAPSAVVAGRENGPEFIIRSSVRDGNITHPDPQCRQRRFRHITAENSPQVIEKILAGDAFRVSKDEIEASYSESAEFNLSPDLRFIWHFPFDAAGQIVGFLALAFTESSSFCELNMDAVQALSQQASLALKVIHLSEEAKRGALACEREKAAQSLASELVNANALIRATLDELANTEDSSGFVKVTLREVCRQAHASAAHLFTYDSSSNRLIQFGVVKGDVFYHAHPDDPPSFREGLDANVVPAFGHLAQRGGIYWTLADAPGVDVSPDTLQWHRKMGHTGYASQVLVVGCKPIGLLGLTYNDGQQLSSKKAELIQVLAQHMALALGLMRLTDRARDTAILAERERAAETRACELAKTNAALRSATDRLATQTELGSFYGHLVEEAAHLLGANSAHLTILDEASHSLRTLAFLKHAVVSVPDYPVELSVAKTSLALERLCSMRGPCYLDLERDADLFSHGTAEFHRASDHRTLAAAPLLLGDRCIGYIGLAFIAEQRLVPEQQELLQTLAQHATLAVHLTRLAEQVRRGAVLEERVALARDMHDTLLQGFTGITLQLRALLKSSAKEASQMHFILEAIEAEATRSVREARRAVGDMRGNEPGTADLVTALQQLVQSESSRSSAHLCWKLEGEPRELPGNVAESVFRIGREALSNAIRHSGATCIEVSLAIAHGSLHLRVKDNGSGLEITQELARRLGHWGLVGMQERAERLGGKWKVESERGHGATISVEVPV